jgi:hypothetical protein
MKESKIKKKWEEKGNRDGQNCKEKLYSDANCELKHKNEIDAKVQVKKSTIIVFPNIMHRPVFLFKTRNVSETGFCLRLQVEPTQKHNNCVNIPSSQTFWYYKNKVKQEMKMDTQN